MTFQDKAGPNEDVKMYNKATENSLLRTNFSLKALEFWFLTLTKKYKKQFLIKYSLDSKVKEDDTRIHRILSVQISEVIFIPPRGEKRRMRGLTRGQLDLTPAWPGPALSLVSPPRPGF